MDTGKSNIGVGVSVVWILVWCTIAYTKGAGAVDMSLNEWGDFMAGIFAPLAFLWLVLGYMQQGEELKQNTKALLQQEEALRLQAEELRQSVEQQKKMVESTQRQTSLNEQALHSHKIESVKRIQPELVYGGGSRSMINTNPHNILTSELCKFTNKGSHATEVKFTATNKVKVDSGIKDAITAGGTVNIRLDFPETLNDDETLFFEYTDKNGVRQKQTFQLKFKGGGVKIVPLSFEPKVE